MSTPAPVPAPVSAAPGSEVHRAIAEPEHLGVGG
jgi:hypothetical protein